jgi:dTDP-4-amino-4,6-dideoxygalactose transaminase
LFHSIEGGMLIFREGGLKGLFDYLKNFGFKNEVEVVMPGTNAKMNEMQALMGIQVLRYLEGMIQKRAAITDLYRNRLKDVPGIHLAPALSPDIHYNYAYMPIEVDEKEFGMSRDALYEKLKEWNVHSRRYFYPLICDYPCYRSISVNGSLSVARRVADCILTLPIYDGLELSDVEIICEIILSLQQGKKEKVTPIVKAMDLGKTGYPARV